MNLKRKIQAILSSLILLCFLAGSTGITLFIHSCSSSGKSEVTAYPEIFKHSSDCCCDDESAGPDDTGTQAAGFSNPECCRNQHIFLKAAIIGFPVIYQQSVKVLQSPAPPVDLLMTCAQQVQKPLAEYLPWMDHSPPLLGGKSLVYFISQIRIPDPAC